MTDGGVYDNLGLETVWKKYTNVLVSDGGAPLLPEPSPRTNWLQHLMRVINIQGNQVGSQRKRQIIESYKQGTRGGTYWGINTDIANYQLSDPLPCPYAKTRKLATVGTRLEDVPTDLRKMLINWGYAVCDAAIRKYGNSFADYVNMPVEAKNEFPYPEVGIG